MFCRPIEACVILLPIYEFLKANTTFSKVLEEYLSAQTDKSARVPPLPITMLSLSSYLLTHATTTSSSRSLAYANLSLSCLLAISETENLTEAFIQPWPGNIRLCRQASWDGPLKQSLTDLCFTETAFVISSIPRSTSGLRTS